MPFRPYLWAWIDALRFFGRSVYLRQTLSLISLCSLCWSSSYFRQAKNTCSTSAAQLQKRLKVFRSYLQCKNARKHLWPFDNWVIWKSTSSCHVLNHVSKTGTSWCNHLSLFALHQSLCTFLYQAKFCLAFSLVSPYVWQFGFVDTCLRPQIDWHHASLLACLMRRLLTPCDTRRKQAYMCAWGFLSMYCQINGSLWSYVIWVNPSRNRFRHSSR